MTPARATLLTFVQCRAMWFWHFMGGALCLVALVRPVTGAGEGAVIAVLAVPLWFGVVSASLWRDLMARPFSFGLPRHGDVWRRSLFWTGAVVAAACGLSAALVPAVSPAALVLRVCEVLVLGMGMFMLAVLLTTSVSNTSFLPAFFSALFFIGLDGNIATRLRLSAERALLGNAWLAILASALVIAVAWRATGSRTLSRKLIGAPFLPLQSMWDGARQRAFASERASRSMVRVEALERLVLSRMRRTAGHPTLRSLWGVVYVQVGRMMPARLRNAGGLAMLLAGITVVLGFVSPRRHAGVSDANLMLMVLCALNAEYRVNPYGTLLLNVSRRNRLLSIAFAAFGQWLAVAVAAAALTAVSLAVGRFAGELTLFGNAYHYTPMHPAAFFLFAPIVPLIFFGQVVFPRHNILWTTVLASVAGIVFVGAAPGALAAPPYALLLVQVASWLPFLAVTRHQSRAGDLSLDG